MQARLVVNQPRLFFTRIFVRRCTTAVGFNESRTPNPAAGQRRLKVVKKLKKRSSSRKKDASLPLAPSEEESVGAAHWDDRGLVGELSAVSAEDATPEARMLSQGVQEVEASFLEHGRFSPEPHYPPAQGTLPAFKLVEPSLHPALPAEPTSLRLNENTTEQSACLRLLFKKCGIGSSWSDYGLINHLSSRDWSVASTRFNTLGRTVLENVVAEEFLHWSLRNVKFWVQDCPPVTFEIADSALYAVSPRHPQGGAHGFPPYDPAMDGEADINNLLSYSHGEQMAAVFLNQASLEMLAEDHGLLGLMHVDSAKGLQASSFTLAEKANPALVMQARELVPLSDARESLDLTETNLGTSSVDAHLGDNLLALVGAVKIEKGLAAAKTVARHVLRLNDNHGTDAPEACQRHLDRLVLENNPSVVCEKIFEYLGIKTEWRTETIEHPLDREDEEANEQDYLEAKVMTDSAEEQRKVVEKQTEAIKAANKQLEEARTKRPAEQQEESQGQLQVRGSDEPAPIDPNRSPLEPTSPEDEVSRAMVTVEDDDDEYALQFDAEGNPIDIRQTSLKYPIEPGPYQSTAPISPAPMYSVPRPDAPLIERLHWKNARKVEREAAKMKLEAVFASLMTPKKLVYKTVMVDRRSGRVLGYGSSTSVSTARVEAHSDALQKIRSNLMGLLHTASSS
ncbi:hypothetical protein DIPPA_13449 [Diplonema papillatum]|nr:hypothetical protein DIPPA_13449 [Diplonema papillatum]